MIEVPEDEITSFAMVCPECNNLIPRGRVEDGDTGSKRLVILCSHCNNAATAEVSAQSISRGPFHVSRSRWDGLLIAIVAVSLVLGAALTFGVWVYRFSPVIGWAEVSAMILVFVGLSFVMSTGTLHILRESRKRRGSLTWWS